MSDENILSFPGSGPQAPDECSIAIEPVKISLCRHERIVLNEERRMVKCAECSRWFDPFSYLPSDARTTTRAWADFRSVKRELGELVERVDGLKAEERRLKARVKTAKEKAEPALCLRGAGVEAKGE